MHTKFLCVWDGVISQLLKIFPCKHKELNSVSQNLKEEKLDMIVHTGNHIDGEADTGGFLGITG